MEDFVNIAPIEPPQAGVHLWHLFVEDTQDDDLVDQYRSLLTPEERERCAAFRFQKDRHRYLVTRALVRTVLSRYAPITPVQWRFEASEYGRPFIANEEPAARMISFNLSHTDGLVILAVTSGRSIGVDVENVRREPPLDLVEHYFFAQEIEAFRALAAPLRPQRFFELWTLKESYIKARGMGLSMPLDQFGFDLAHPYRITMSVNAHADDSPARWRFRQMRPSGDHLVALCVEAGQSPADVITARRVVPLRFESVVDFSVFRDSGG